MMSHRGKRQALTRLDDITPVATKRRKGRPPALAEEEDASAVELRLSFPSVASTSDMKISSIYNRSGTEAPAELFRKDLISAMKLPDSEPLTSDHYWVITDQWKQEWERGVQVPVKPDSLPGPVVSVASSHNSRRSQSEFKLPKNKYIRITKDEHFRLDEHYLSNAGFLADKSCAYDLEDVDVVWLNIMNGERALMGLKPISQDQLERVIEELEMRCWEKVHAIVKKEEGLALEFDESVICDVCRSPDSEEGNEMVFCDRCNICVHQACYGITSIPEGSWECRTCSIQVRPECVLCPNKNGAMKSTRSGQKWAHVSCALWIPEVSIGCVEKMEPITRISSIPGSRWALICVLCRERVGACIQCSVKTCKTAYHVTCAFKHGLEMRAIIDEDKSSADDKSTVKLRSYCQKHSIINKKETAPPPAGEDEEVKKKQRRDLTSEEKTQARAVKLQEIEAEFEKHVHVKDITRKHNVDLEGLEYIYNYWVLKRRAAFNKPLIPSRSEDASNLQNKNQEQQTEEKMRMFVQLRQDLERVRNLCYMVSRREKISRMYQRIREQTFHKQATILSEYKGNLSSLEIIAIKEANRGPSIYDRVYSHPNAPDLSTDFETMVRRIAGYSDSDSPRHGANGFVFSSSSSKENKRARYNGEMKSPGSYDSISSSTSDVDAKNRLRSESESEAPSKLNNQTNKFQRKNVVEANTKNRARRRQLNSPYNESSTEAEDDTVAKCSKVKPAQRPKKNNAKKQSTVSRSFELLERGITSGSGSAGDDTEDDLFIKKPKGGFKKKNNVCDIYSSDSESTDKDDDTKPSRNKVIRTKASMKEFTAIGGSGRSTKGAVPLNSVKRKKVNNLFNDESDKSDKLSANESDVFVSSRKPLKGATTSSALPKSRAKPKGEGAKSQKSPKNRKELETSVYANDDIGNSGANYLDALPLVPQRAAAKKAIKAIEHIKNGMVKPTSAFDELETFKSSVKSAKCIKKDQLSSTTTTKHKSADVDGVKTESRTSAFEKRTSHQKSISSGIHHPNVGSSASPVSAIATVAASCASGSNNSAFSNSSATALTAPVAKPAHASSSSKNASSSSSGSSSGSSSSGSTSSSGSSSGSSSSGSSSGSSSSGSSSSSSSSESEAEDAPTKVATKKPLNETTKVDAAKAAISNTSMTPVHKPMPECKKRELEAMKKTKEKAPGSEQDVSGLADGKWKPEVSPQKSIDHQKLNESPPKKEPDNENCSIAISETNAAVEQITSGEPEFTMPYWELAMGKNELPPENEIGGKESPMRAACRGPSLFSPIKDIDFASFDGDLAENNNLVDNNFSLASLSSIFTNELVYKEDTKEDSVRETLNLVEKLKSEMARKQISHSDENVESIQSTGAPDLNTNMEVTNSENANSENAPKQLADKTGDEIVTNVESSPPPPTTTNETQSVDQMLAAEDSVPSDHHTGGGLFDWRSFPSDMLPPQASTTPIKESDPASENVNTTNMSWPHHTGQMMGAAYTQSLTIHTPCAATASFTTTSQNMAMITSLISPTPPLGSDDTVATPVSGSSVNFEERFAEMACKPVQAIANTADNTHVDVSQEQSLPEKKPEDDNREESQKANNGSLFQDVIDVDAQPPTPKKDPLMTSATVDRTDINLDTLPSAEKDTLFANVMDRDETVSDVDPPAEKKEPEQKNVPEPSVTVKSIPVTVTPSSVGVAASAAVPSSTPPMKTPQTPSYTKKSPTRPTRASARVSSQNKSPATKSPVVSTSPIRSDVTPAVKGKRESGSRKNHRVNKTTTNRRGRGRGRGRNALSNCFYRDWDGDTIQDKLVGTVYDFDDEEEPVSDNFENLRALRERRKSTDTPYCDRLSTSSKDTCYSPKFACPSPQLPHSKRKGSVASTPDRRGSHRSQLSPLCEIGNNSRVMQKDLYRPEDEDEEEEEEDQAGEQEEEEEESLPVVCKKPTGNSKSERATSHASATSQGASQSRDQFSNIGGLQPLLPGAVDMRTYSGDGYESAQAAASNDFGNAAIASLDTASVAESASDMVEDFEKELQNYPFVPMSAGQSPRNSSAVASPRLANDASKPESYARNRIAGSPAGNYFADENVENARSERQDTFLDGEQQVSRNQLRVKIKGPYSDANYAHCTTTASSTASAQQLASVSNSGAMLSSSEVFPVSSVSLTNTYTSISSTSSSNLRRMRKKELLEQYKAQGDESGNDVLSTSQNFGLAGEAHSGMMAGNSPVKSIPPYKIPKAVASMTTIPTKEDYKAVLETAAYIEKKKRGKDKSSTCLDAADISNNNSNYNNNMYHTKQANNTTASRSPDNKTFSNYNSCGYNANNVVDNHGSKRKSRSTSSSAPPPKLKIKIGPQPTVVVDPVCTDLKARPPKKRLCDQSDVVPSASTVEQYRESMRYRSRVISEFNENGHRDTGVYSVYDEFSDGESGSIKSSDRKKRKKRSSSTSRSSRRRKKQQRSSSRDIAQEHTCDEGNEKRVQVITNTENGRIIIKFGAGKKEKKEASSSNPSTESSATSPPTAVAPAKPSKSSKRNVNHELDSVRTNKITPIRLKLARSKDGYVTKPSCPEKETSDSATTNAAAFVDTLPKGSQATAETTVGSVSSGVESANAQALPVSTAS